MFYSAAKKMLQLKPWYIAVYLLVLIILIVSSLIEYRSRYRDVLALIQNQAAMTAAVIAQSGTGQAYLTEELKQSYIDRAIDVLSILNKVDAIQDIGTHRLNELIDEGNILKIIIFDKDGEVEHAVVKDPARKQMTKTHVVGKMARKHIAPLLAGEQELVIVGVDQIQDPSRSGVSPLRDNESRFLIAIARDRGGALACQLSVSAEEDFRYLTAIETALEDLLKVKDLQYLQLAIDENEPFYVSKNGLTIDSTWIREPLEDILFQVSKKDIKLLEIVRPIFFNNNIGEVRIGFNSVTLSSLKSQIIVQILIRMTLLTVLSFVTLIFLLTRQNAALLVKEKDRIESEVYRLEKLNRQREKQAAIGELAAGVAHEIRNPLNAIGIIAQRLRREFEPSKANDDYQTLTGTMVSEIVRINRSLQDFLEYTRPTPLNYEVFDLDTLVKNILELYQTQANQKQVGLSSSSPSIIIEADIEFLKQALSNLVKNAIEACESGENISLSTKQMKSVVSITIQDSGIGIKSEDVNRIFDLYYTTKDMGTGVGLALTHKIIADHGGTIEVKSTPGHGSKFEINIPVKQ